MASLKLSCERCGEEHVWMLAEEDISEGRAFNLACQNVKRLPRVMRFRIDTTRNFSEFEKDYPRSLIVSLHGELNIEEKIKRWSEVNEPRLWFIHDFDEFVEEILHAYVAGNFYPVTTACTTLAERLVNLFIIKMRDSFDKNLLGDDLKKYVYSKDQSWQNHDKNIKVLSAWGLLSDEQKECFSELYKIRRRAVHYQKVFDAKVDASKAVVYLRKLIDSYFSQFVRKDVLRVFEIPGEIWVREDKISDPFIKAFVLPNCKDFASHGVVNKKRQYHEKDAIAGIFSEAEFIEQRKNYKGEAEVATQNYETQFKECSLEDGRIVRARII